MMTHMIRRSPFSTAGRLALYAALILFTAGTLPAQKPPKEITSFPALHRVKMPDVRTVTLKNGMKIYLVEDHQYPTIDMRAMIKTGSVYDPSEKTGLASITGTVLRTGGTTARTGDEIDRMLETMGGSVETGIGRTSGYAFMSVLKMNADKGLDILADILMHPAFSQDKIDLAKIEMRSMISRRNDDILEITGREFNSLIYGKGNVYARYPEYETVDNITRDDITTFYSRYFHPNNIILAAWGDFDSKEMQKKLEAAFGGWQTATVYFPEKTDVNYRFRYAVNFIQKSDVSQSHIQMGHIGGLLSEPDYPALVIMNQILSTERMAKVLRTKEGLTYAPWGYYGAEFDHLGVFSCGTQTKSHLTVYAIKLMLNEVKRITEEPVTKEELQRAKDGYLNSFVFNFDSKSKIVTRMMTYAYFGYPLDFIDKLREGVEKVTADDVLRAAKSHLRPDELQILVVGNMDDFDEPLSTLGEVNDIDVSIPEPRESSAEESMEGSLVKGRELFDKSMTASGGADAFRAIRGLWVKAGIVRPGEPEMEAEITLLYPDRLRYLISSSVSSVKMILAGDKGWVSTPMGKMPMQESVMKNLRGDIIREASHFYSLSDNLRIQFLGEKLFARSNSFELLISTGDDSFHLYLNPTTYLPAGVSYKTTGPGGPINVEEFWSDYRDVGQVKLPFKSLSTVNGKTVSESTIIEMKHNVEINPALFEEEE